MTVASRDRRADSGVALPTVAVVGRPNVGKSTLFNRVVGERVAIVAERPGVTRDRNFSRAEWAGRPFLLVDTGGIQDRADAPLEEAVRRQVLAAIEHADVLIFVVDAGQGVAPVDLQIADLLRESGRPVQVAVNKMDNPAGDLRHHEFWSLGLGEPQPVSAMTGKGSGDLLDRVVEKLPAGEPSAPAGVDLSLAVVGRPNVGKSSLVNRLLGEERVVVHEEAGTTRDAIDTYLEYGDRTIQLIDTAGLRRQSRVSDDVEFYSRVRAAAAIRRAEVCVLVVDCEAGVANQDFRIGEDAWDQGRGLVLAANKWDLVEDRGPSVVANFVEALRDRAAYLRWVPVVTTSALTGQRVRKVLDLALEVRAERSRRIPTAEVNRVLEGLVGRRQPPQGGSGDVRILYGSQVASEPPLFAVWSNRPEEIPAHYLRYLENGFRDAWGFEGVPVRIKTKESSGREPRGYRV